MSGERGISIQQTPDFLIVTVNDGVNTWTARASEENFDYDYWQYLSVRWSGDDGLSVGINGTQLATQVIGNCIRSLGLNYTFHSMQYKAFDGCHLGLI